jgi:Fur family ferric uptake transcriptional regulator
MRSDPTKQAVPALRMTRQRRAILQALRQGRAHPAADQVYQVVRRRLPRISLGTVYRNLELLAKRGLIRELRAGGEARRFDGMTEPHYHARCLRCGRVDDVAMKPVAAIEKAARRLSGYAVTGHQVEFVGLCPTCQAQQSTARRQARRKHRKEH